MVKVALALLSVGVASAEDILILGDSNAAFSNLALSQYCLGKTVVNRAIKGSTAQQWAAGTASTCSTSGADPAGDSSICCTQRPSSPTVATATYCTPLSVAETNPVSSCAVSDAGSSSFGSGYTHIWLSIGGNDYLAATTPGGSDGCTHLSQSDLQTRIANVITQVRSVFASADIVMLGHLQPTQIADGRTATFTNWFGSGCSASSVVTINAAQQAACAADSKCTFIDSIAAAGGSASSLSTDGTYHCPSDPIHANAKGYCRIFSHAAVQSAFGCEPQVFDCTAGSDYTTMITAASPSTPPSLPPPSPPPPPLLPPPLSPGGSIGGEVTVVVSLAISIQEFDASVQASFKANLATAAGSGVTADDISLSIVAGSITVTATILTPSVAAAHSASSSVASAIAVDASSGTFLGLAVTATPAAPIVAAVLRPAPSPPPPSRSGNTGAVVVGGLVGGIVGGVSAPLFALLGIYAWRQKQQQAKTASAEGGAAVSCTASDGDGSVKV